MADTIRVPQNRDARVVHNMPDKIIGSARDQQIDILVHGEQLADLGACFQQSDPTVRHTRRLTGFVDDVRQDPVGLPCFRAALQKDGVAAFQAESGNLHERIRPRFKNHANHTDRAADPIQVEAIVQPGCQQRAADRLGQADQTVQSSNDFCQFGRIKAQSFQKRRCQTFCLTARQIRLVGCKNRIRVLLETNRNLTQAVIFHRASQRRCFS